jgi:hypothetical protein
MSYLYKLIYITYLTSFICVSICRADQNLQKIIDSAKVVILIDHNGNIKYLKGHSFDLNLNHDWIDQTHKNSISFIFTEPKIKIISKDAIEVTKGMQLSIFTIKGKKSVFLNKNIYTIDIILSKLESPNPEK